MDMGHTPYGYRIENGLAVIDEIEGAAVKKLYEGYLGGLGLVAAATEAGIKVNHCQAKRMMLNKKYLGTDYYPALVTKEVQEKVKEELARRAESLGRVFEPKEENTRVSIMRFHFLEVEKEYTDPLEKAEYLYSLIEGVQLDG